MPDVSYQINLPLITHLPPAEGGSLEVGKELWFGTLHWLDVDLKAYPPVGTRIACKLCLEAQESRCSETGCGLPLSGNNSFLRISDDKWSLLCTSQAAVSV